MQDSKFLYKDSFGETLSEKYRPAILIFDLEKNELNQVFDCLE